MTFGQALIYSLLGLLVVFFALVLLMCIIKIMTAVGDRADCRRNAVSADFARICVAQLQARLDAAPYHQRLLAEVFDAGARERVIQRRHHRATGDFADGARVDAVFAEHGAQENAQLVAGRAFGGGAAERKHDAVVFVYAARKLGVPDVKCKNHNGA
mgnify:CR=1 FL=1